MKHNVFDTDKRDDKSFLSHAAQKEILDLAKSSGVGSLKAAMEIYMDEHSLQHDGISGFVQSGTGDVTTLFPEYVEAHPGVHLNSLQMIWDGLTLLWRRHRKFRMVAFVLPNVDIRNIDSPVCKGI